MAIIQEQQTDAEATLKVTNGDFQAMKKIKDQYGLGDVSDVLVFALGVLSQANGQPVSISSPEGPVKLMPSDKLLKQEQQSNGQAE
jgi:hypothetical protein